MTNPVQQSGSITPGHLAEWVTTGVIKDSGFARYGSAYLAAISGADFNSTADQIIQFPNTITAFNISAILITNASLSLTTAVGGFYPTTAKGGTAIVANTQVYSSLTTAAKLLSATLAANAATTRYSSSNVDNIDGYLSIYLSLTTAQAVAATADVYIIGTDLTVR